MALSAQSVFSRMGYLFGGINESNTFSGTTLATRVDNITGQFSGFSQQREVVDDIDTDVYSVQSSLSTWNDTLFTRVSETLRTMCRDDSARPRSESTVDLFFKLNADMKTAGKNITRPAITSTIATVGTAIGDGTVIASVIEPIDGEATYYAYGEVIRIVCNGDSYSGATSAGSETFSVNGETSVDARSVYWPKGSGAATTLTATTPATSGILTDGELDNWGGTGNNVPASWSLFGSTAAGTNLFREGTTVKSGNYAARFLGDGATIIGIYQNLDQTIVRSNTNYAISFWYRSSSGSTTGTLRVALVDGTGTVITDNLGTSQSDTSINSAALQAANGTWVLFTGVLRTPRNLPTVLALDLRFSSALSAHSVYVDRVNMGAMTAIYAGGPYMAIHSGPTGFALNDTYTDTITNSKTTTNFVRCLDRAFLLAQQGIRLITTASANIADSLIT